MDIKQYRQKWLRRLFWRVMSWPTTITLHSLFRTLLMTGRQLAISPIFLAAITITDVQHLILMIVRIYSFISEQRKSSLGPVILPIIEEQFPCQEIEKQCVVFFPTSRSFSSSIDTEKGRQSVPKNCRQSVPGEAWLWLAPFQYLVYRPPVIFFVPITDTIFRVADQLSFSMIYGIGSSNFFEQPHIAKLLKKKNNNINSIDFICRNSSWVQCRTFSVN